MTDIAHVVVFDNKAFVLEEVANAEVASRLVNRCPAIDAGENIKLYCTHSLTHACYRLLSTPSSLL